MCIQDPLARKIRALFGEAEAWGASDKRVAAVFLRVLEGRVTIARRRAAIADQGSQVCEE